MSKVVERLREKWQEWTGEEDTPFDGDMSAWTVSFLVHIGVVVALAVLVLVYPQQQITLVIETETEEEVEDELKDIEEVYFDMDDTSDDVGANSMAGEMAALAQAQVLSEESLVVQDVPDIENPTINMEFEEITVNSGPVLSDNMAVKGSPVGQGVTGAPGAVDRITYEILESLAQRKTMVVWLFDQSGSLQQQRQQIYERFDKIYSELGVLKDRNHKSFTKYKNDNDKPLLTSVMAFGQNVSFLTEEPTADFPTIKDAVGKIENDPSGVEKTFEAIKIASTQHAKHRHLRNVMLVVVSDEVGDDERGIEDALTVLRRYQMPVYVVGIPAPFGRAEAKVRYVNHDPKYEETEYWIPVRQGPESLMPERIKLAFWGSRKDREEVEALDSGFGPFSLTRLCYETGGIYFAVHPNKSRKARAENRVGRKYTEENTALLYKFWDPITMRPYAPDYVTPQEYVQKLQTNKARGALVGAARESWVGAMGTPETTFVKRDEGSFGAALIEAQKSSARLEPKLRRILEILKTGEADRDKLTEPRWQAGFDLAMGRVLAAVARTEGYNAMLAELKRGKKFEGENNNTWDLKHSDAITTSSSTEKMAEKARTYLQRVVKEHKGTPWAFLAQKELETPMGWEWVESHTNVAPRQQGAGGGNGTAANPNDMINKLKRKPKAPKPKL